MNVEHLMMDASVLLPPTGTPLTGIDFVRRLPCGEVERARKVSLHTSEIPCRGEHDSHCFFDRFLCFAIVVLITNSKRGL